MTNVLAIDLGASSGRALLGRLADGRIEVEELHRFPNDPVQVGDRLQWDVLRLLHEIKQALLKAKHQGIELTSMAIDSWAVDFGLIGRNGELLGNPYHYRDLHTEGVMEQLLGEVEPAEIFSRTGIQFLPFNTIYQLYALKQADSPLLREAERFLMIPDLLRYFLTGEMVNEFSNATTTQLFNPLTGDWDEELLKRIGISQSLFGRWCSLERWSADCVLPCVRSLVSTPFQCMRLPSTTRGQQSLQFPLWNAPSLT
jgi:rhamnulokinase